MHRGYLSWILLASMFSGLFPLYPSLALAESTSSTPPNFNPNYILSDDDVFDVHAMDYPQLASFLRQRGALGSMMLADIDGVEKSVADIIWRVAQSYKINPKYLLALIQKEQSLVEDPNPSQAQLDWAAGYAICDACKKNDPSVQEFKGFASQLEWSAKQHREKYLFQLLARGVTIGGQGLGKSVMIDGTQVTPLNMATAMLYSYTPHLHGNINLWKVWQRWFHVAYPDGTIVRGQPSGKTYTIRFGQKRAFASPAVVASLVNERQIVEGTDEELRNIPDGPTIKFPQYALLRDPDQQLYLIVGEEKRHIVDQEAFKKFGFNADEIDAVQFEDLEPYRNGISITTKTAFPQGVLVKTRSNSDVWYVENGERHAILDPVLLTRYFKHRQIKIVTDKTLQQYPLQEPYHLHDGELIRTRSNPTVYVVENKTLRPIPSGMIFERVGWKWDMIVTVSDSLRDAHAVGTPFEPQNSNLQLTLNSL